MSNKKIAIYFKIESKKGRKILLFLIPYCPVAVLWLPQINYWVILRLTGLQVIKGDDGGLYATNDSFASEIH